MKFRQYVTICALFLIVAGTSAAQEPAASLQDLIGARGSSGEGELQRRGYTFIRTEKSSDSAYSYWQEQENGQCVTVRTTDGRYASIVYAPYSDCQGGGSNTADAMDRGWDRKDEFQTVCGVFQDGKPYTSKCKAVDFYIDDHKIKTALHWPDLNMRLVWKDGGHAVVHMEGTKPYHVHFSTSEGETNFQIDGKTYFYISDKGLARMEVENFRN